MSKKILLVDDEAFILLLGKKVLADAYELTTADAALEASNLLQTQTFDLLVTDINMPNMTGIELANEFRAKQPTAPVITMTGNITNEMRATLNAANIHIILAKPFTPKTLLAEVAQALQ